MAVASASTISRTTRKLSAAVCRRSTRSGNVTFLFINIFDELAGNSTCLAMREHVYQLGSRPSEAVKGLPLDGELRLLIQ